MSLKRNESVRVLHAERVLARKYLSGLAATGWDLSSLFPQERGSSFRTRNASQQELWCCRRGRQLRQSIYAGSAALSARQFKTRIPSAARLRTLLRAKRESDRDGGIT